MRREFIGDRAHGSKGSFRPADEENSQQGWQAQGNTDWHPYDHQAKHQEQAQKSY